MISKYSGILQKFEYNKLSQYILISSPDSTPLNVNKHLKLKSPTETSPTHIRSEVSLEEYNLALAHSSNCLYRIVSNIHVGPLKHCQIK